MDQKDTKEGDKKKKRKMTEAKTTTYEKDENKSQDVTVRIRNCLNISPFS